VHEKIVDRLTAAQKDRETFGMNEKEGGIPQGKSSKK